MNLIGFLVSFLCLQATPAQEPIPSLQSNPLFKKWTWVEKKGVNYLPFVFIVGKEADSPPEYLNQIENDYSAPLAVLLDTWKNNWTTPLKLQPTAAGTTIPIVLLPYFDDFKAIYEKLYPQESQIAAYYIDGNGLVITYHRGTKFESKVARRKAILKVAAEKLVQSYAVPGKPVSLWLMLGLENYLGEIKEQPGGRAGVRYVWSDTTDWRQEFPRLAEALRGQKIPVPGFEELLKFKTLEQVDEKATSLAKMANIPSQSVLNYYRSYVRLASYSILVFFRGGDGEKLFSKPFNAFVQDEFKGEGGFEKFQSRFRLNFASAMREWEAFVDLRKPILEPEPAPATTSTPNNPTTPAAKPAAAEPILNPSGLPISVPLSLVPDNLLDLRAEIIRAIRNKKFEEVIKLFGNEQLQRNPNLQRTLSTEASIIDGPLHIYESFGKLWKPKDTLPSGFGISGEIVSANEQSFELKERPGIHKWSELDLRVVATHLYYTVKQNDPETSIAFAKTLMISGETTKAKKILEPLVSDANAGEQAQALLAKIPEFDAASKEATIREEAEKIEGLDSFAAMDMIRKLSSKPEYRDTSFYLKNKPYFLGVATRFLEKRFDTEGIAECFKGQVKTWKDGTVMVHYNFKEPKEFFDWTPTNYPFLDEAFGQKSYNPGANWGVTTGSIWVKPPGAFVHNANWVGDVAIEFTLKAQKPEPNVPTNSPLQFLAGVCDDGKGNFLGCFNLTQAFRSSSTIKANLIEKITQHMTVGKDYKIKLSRSNDKIQVTPSDSKYGIKEDQELKGGRVFFYTIGPLSFTVANITITGKPDPVWIDPQKIPWVKKELKNIFPDF